ncbi:MAG: Rid family hydrolase [Anaerolineae bacterium]|nr:Rid family hydrolase [Anaerolineae bacterium]
MAPLLAKRLSAFNGFVYTAGQIPLIPWNEALSLRAIFKHRHVKPLENVKGAVEAAGSTLAHVVKTTAFLKDMDDFARSE